MGLVIVVSPAVINSHHFCYRAKCSEVFALCDGLQSTFPHTRRKDFLISSNRIEGERWIVDHRKEQNLKTLRTIAKMIGIDYSRAYDDHKAHDALSDAKAQAQVVQIILQAIT